MFRELSVKFVRRFISKINIGSKDECWEWNAYKDPNGYGMMSIKNYPNYAHRLAYEVCHGPIPEGLVVRHMCHNPSCCNPSHLKLGSQKDNLQDMVDAGRKVVIKGSEHSATCFTENDIKTIRSLHKSKARSYSQLAKKYGVHASTICHIVTKRTWKHI